MPRTKYYRKRSGFRSYISALWERIEPFTQGEAVVAADSLASRDLAALRSEGMTDEQVATMFKLFTEFGAAVSASTPKNNASSNVSSRMPEAFALGAEMPAGRFNRATSLFQAHLRPKGRPRKPARGPRRPAQADVNLWMLSHGEAALVRDGRAPKETMAVAACMAEINASRMQARVAFARLPLGLRRQRGQHDRWVKPSRS